VLYDFASSVINVVYITTIQSIYNITTAHFKLHYLLIPNTRAMYVIYLYRTLLSSVIRDKYCGRIVLSFFTFGVHLKMATNIGRKM